MSDDVSTESQRVDKWMWYARVVKSRTLAQKLAVGGKVRVNSQKIDSASQRIKVGDTLTIRLARRILIYKVLSAGTRRGPASEARHLYQDLSPPPEKKPAPPTAGREGGRPTKKDRRRMDAFRNGERSTK